MRLKDTVMASDDPGEILRSLIVEASSKPRAGDSGDTAQELKAKHGLSEKSLGRLLRVAASGGNLVVGRRPARNICGGACWTPVYQFRSKK